MTTFFIQNEYWENKDFILVKTSSFWVKEVAIWWLFDDELRVRGQETEKKAKRKEPEIPRPSNAWDFTHEDLDYTDFS